MKQGYTFLIYISANSSSQISFNTNFDLGFNMNSSYNDVASEFLDDFSGEKRAELMEKVRSYNPRGTFPVVLMPNGKVIVGFRKTLLEEAMKK